MSLPVFPSTISSEPKRFQIQTHEIPTPDRVPNMQLLQPILAEARVGCKALGFEKLPRMR